MNYKEYQNWRKSRKNQQKTFSKPSAKRAPQGTKRYLCTSVTSARCISVACETMQVQLDRFTMQDLLEKHGFERHGGYWI